MTSTQSLFTFSTFYANSCRCYLCWCCLNRCHDFSNFPASSSSSGASSWPLACFSFSFRASSLLLRTSARYLSWSHHNLPLCAHRKETYRETQWMPNANDDAVFELLFLPASFEPPGKESYWKIYGRHFLTFFAKKCHSSIWQPTLLLSRNSLRSSASSFFCTAALVILQFSTHSSAGRLWSAVHGPISYTRSTMNPKR